MRKIIISIMAVCALMLTQCKKNIEQVTPVSGLTGETIEVSVEVTTDGGDRTEITAAGVVTWNVGDKLYVVGETSGYLGYVTAQGGGSYTVFEGVISKSETPQNYRFYYVGQDGTISGDTYTYNVATQYGTLNGTNGISKKYQLMKSTPIYIDGPTPARFGTIEMYSMNAIARMSFKKDGSTYSTTVTLSGSCSTATLNTRTGELTPVAGDITLKNTSADYYISLIPTGSKQNLVFCASNLNKRLDGVTVEANKMYNQSSAKVIDVSGWLTGIFSVSSNTRVKFAKGNLQYRGWPDGSGKWYFAENQWDYLGNGSNYCSAWIYGYVLYNYASANNASGNGIDNFDRASARDLFGWGTSGWNNGNYFYMPYNCSNKESLRYSKLNGFGYGPRSGVIILNYDHSLTGDYVCADWTAHTINNNLVQNAVKSYGTARTLTKDEWYYLLVTRCVNGGCGDGRSYKRTTLTLQDGRTVYGMIIVPDNYCGPLLTANTSWDTWTSLEACGSVFLPVTCKRVGAGIGYSENGYYWSTTKGGQVHLAFCLQFGKSMSPVIEDYYRYDGCAVRGVKVQ